jgi:hypothetical protein
MKRLIAFVLMVMIISISTLSLAEFDMDIYINNDNYSFIRDDFTGNTAIRVKRHISYMDNYITGSLLQVVPIIGIYGSNQSDPMMMLEFSFEFTSWLFIDEIIVLVDGMEGSTKYTFTNLDVSRQVTEYGIKESFFIYLTDSSFPIFDAIVDNGLNKTSNVRIRLVGRDTVWDTSLTIYNKYQDKKTNAAFAQSFIMLRDDYIKAGGLERDFSLYRKFDPKIN